MSKEDKPNEIGYLTTKTVAVDIGGMIYNQGKAKIFNVLESQIDEPRRLRACKRIVEDILTKIARDASQYLIDILGDWEAEVEYDPDAQLPENEAAEAEKEHQKIKEILQISE